MTTKPGVATRGIGLRALAALSLAFGAATAQPQAPATLAQVQDLGRMSLEELSRLEVTSVLKSPQLLNTAAAAIYVITHEDIVRSGVLSIPEALRLAPNLNVGQVTSSSYAISARGFNDNRETQAFANKLLILVDGRTAYSPLFSGVFYDAIDVVMDDVERIEVISGPGASLWGANAMNGVINIITRAASQTQGTLVRLNAGTSEQAVSARFGGEAGAMAYRVYAKAFDRSSLELADGSSARDRWGKRQGGFRLDWSADRHAVTVQGDAFHADNDHPVSDELAHSGQNVVARWGFTGARSETRVQAYFDHTEREAPADGAAYDLDTYDVEFQQTIALGSRHSLTWGGGSRRSDYDIRSEGPLQFEPAHRSLDLASVFVQDTVSLPGNFTVTAGLKLEDNPFMDWTALPDLRIAWAPDERNLLWAAASRAIRAPTPFDVDVLEFVGPTLFLTGNPDFASEKVRAYEVGYRGQPNAAVSFTVSAFYDDYERLRTAEFGPTGIPLIWDNLLGGNTYGFEGWANVQVRPWWRLSPGFRTLKKRLRFEPESSGLAGLPIAGNDPSYQVSLNSSMDLGHATTLDAFLRYVDELPAPRNPAYYELSARLAWQATANLEIAVSGFNLLHSRHREHPLPIGEAIERSYAAELRFGF